MSRWLIRLVLVGAIVFVAIQLVPYGRAHDNPPVTQGVEWQGARTEQLFNDACADCHSNETEWPWYSNIAPVSWLVYRDVVEGREALNWSEWDREQEEAGEAAETVEEGEMPPRIFTITHPEARLSESEKAELALGLVETFGREDDNSGPGGGE